MAVGAGLPVGHGLIAQPKAEAPSSKGPIASRGPGRLTQDPNRPPVPPCLAPLFWANRRAEPLLFY